MGNVLPLPKRPKAQDNLIYLASQRKSNVIDLARVRSDLLKMSKEIDKVKARLRLRLVRDNGKAQETRD